MKKRSTTKSETKTEFALNAYGGQGEVIAQSWDGGQTWEPIRRSPKREERRQYTRRVLALVENRTPSIARRIEVPFTVMPDAGILAGWAPFSYITTQLGDQDVDGLITPYLLEPDQIAALKRVTHTLILDIDTPRPWTQADWELFDQTVTHYDGVTVPTQFLAGKLRSYHQHVFAVPHLLLRSVWSGIGKTRDAVVSVGVPVDRDETLEQAITQLATKYGPRVAFEPFDWEFHFPNEEPLVYGKFDVVVLPPLSDRYQASLAPILPAMAAQCVVVADREWPLIRHRTDGLIVGRRTVAAWVQELNGVIADSRLRIRLGRAAQNTAARWAPEIKRSQIFLPYRLLVPERDPFLI